MLTRTLTELALAAGAFTGGHFLLSGPAVRRRLVAALGERRFAALYSLAMLLAFVWLVGAYGTAPRTVWWATPAWAPYLVLILMPGAFVLLAGLNPRGDAPDGGMHAVTRHPMLWAFTLWSGSHLIANGEAAAAIFFGGFLLLAVLGTFAIDAKLRRRDPERWARTARVTSNLPFLALLAGRTRLSAHAVLWPIVLGLGAFVLVLWLHRWLFGVSPFPA